MSYEWQSLRRSSHLGPKSGLSLNQSQQILRMHEISQKSRRVSLSADFGSNHKTTDSPDLAHLSALPVLPQHKPLSQSQQQSLSQHTSAHTSANTSAHPSHPSPLDCAAKQSSTSSTDTTDANHSEDWKPSIRANGLSDIVECKTTNSSNSYSTYSTPQSVVNNSINCNNNLNAITGLTSGQSLSSFSTPTAMLPMISYDNLVMSRPNHEMSGRMSRRSSKSTPESFTCSQQSILSAMDRFVKSVNNMDSTVLVPSKLRDMDIPGTKVVRIPPALANTDLHSFYQMLNEVKKELLWGPGSQHNQTANVIPMSGRSSPQTQRDLKHIRQPSDDSLGSLGSTASSSSDQDTDSEADSLMTDRTDRDSIDEHTSHLAAAFRHHLQGLHTILHQLADSADFLSSRYQEDIDASSL